MLLFLLYICRSSLAAHCRATTADLIAQFFFFRTYLNQGPLVNAVQTQDVVFRGSKYNNITAVYAFEIGYTQYAQAWIVSGGIGRNNVTVRAQSARGYGFYYQVEVWGR